MVRCQTTWNLEDLVMDFGLKPKTNGEPLMCFMTVVGVISSDLHFPWDRGREEGRKRGTVCARR